MLDSNDRLGLRSITSELATIRLDAPALELDTLLQIQELIGLDSMAIYSLRERAERWTVDRWLSSNNLLPLAAGTAKLFAQERLPVFYNPAAAPAAQRNRVIEVLSWLSVTAPDTFETSEIYRRVLVPAGLHRHHQPRVLVCDGPDVLAWFGGFHEATPTPRQHRLLGVLIEPVRRRLIAERRMARAPLERATIDALLDRIGSPAFVVDEAGFIQETNRSGRVFLETRGADVAKSLSDATHGRPTPLVFERVEIKSPGMPRSWLAMLQVDPLDKRIAMATSTCVRQWRLTPRQTQVLELVVRGNATATIAATLGCTERAVELHLTKLFDLAGVAGRAALVAAVLTA